MRIRTHTNPLKRFELHVPEWHSVFADPGRPFCLEFGSSKGEFMLRHAVLVPEMNILGTEIRKPLVDEVREKIRESGLRNLHIEYGNIAGRLREFTPIDRIDRLYILFPDPWPKKRHFKRRVFSGALLEEAASLMPSGGDIIVMTDHLSMKEWIDETLAGETFGFETAAWLDLGIRSAWEEHCMATERAVHRYRLVKRG